MKIPILTLAVLLLLAGCADRALPAPSQALFPHAETAKVHLATSRKPAKAAKTDLAERDVLLAKKAFLSRSPGSAERAAKLYRAAAARGSAVAEYNLGVIYEGGLGVSADRTRAEAWYRRAIDSRDPAMRTLASTGLANITANPTAKPSQAGVALLSLQP